VDTPYGYPVNWHWVELSGYPLFMYSQQAPLSGIVSPAAPAVAPATTEAQGLTAERRVSVSTHRQPLAALLFRCRKVFGLRLPWMQQLDRPQREPRLPVVLSVAEVGALLAPRGAGGTVRSPLDAPLPA
jgi:hypothetical protein